MIPFRPFAVAVLPLLATPGMAQTVLLRFRPPVGKTASYTMTMAMRQSFPGMTAPMSFTQVTPMTVRVVAKTPAGTRLETKTGRAKVNAPSTGPLAGMKAQMEKAGMGTTTTATVDELGNLKGLGGTGSGPAAAMARLVGAGMMQGAQGVAYPKKALKVGDTWGSSVDLGKVMGGAMGGAMRASGKIPIVYRLQSLQGGFAAIAVVMKGGLTMSMGTNPMRMAMDTRGTIVVDAATGLMRSMAMTSDTSVILGAQGQRMQQHVAIAMAPRS